MEPFNFDEFEKEFADYQENGDTEELRTKFLSVVHTQIESAELYLDQLVSFQKELERGDISDNTLMVILSLV